jgi:hypothetical protein
MKQNRSNIGVLLALAFLCASATASAGIGTSPRPRPKLHPELTSVKVIAELPHAAK